MHARRQVRELDLKTERVSYIYETNEDVVFISPLEWPTDLGEGLAVGLGDVEDSNTSKASDLQVVLTLGARVMQHRRDDPNRSLATTDCSAESPPGHKAGDRLGIRSLDEYQERVRVGIAMKARLSVKELLPFPSNVKLFDAFTQLLKKVVD